jgi:cytoskeletal protein CcmA (bactofilin family)
MLTAKKKVEEAVAGQGVNLIGEGTSIDGDVKANGDIRVDGRLKGDLETPARLVIGPRGWLQGNVQCQHAEVIGQLIGDLHVNETLTLRASARIDGNIRVGRLIIESGATFTGSCSMPNSEKEQ